MSTKKQDELSRIRIKKEARYRFLSLVYDVDPSDRVTFAQDLYYDNYLCAKELFGKPEINTDDRIYWFLVGAELIDP